MNFLRGKAIIAFYFKDRAFFTLHPKKGMSENKFTFFLSQCIIISLCL
jgi:hypothetical protein